MLAGEPLPFLWRPSGQPRPRNAEVSPLRLAHLSHLWGLRMSIPAEPARQKKGVISISKKSVCLRKLRHLNFLSALKHAAQVPENEFVVIYPCSECEGLHVGHSITDPAWALKRWIARAERRIQRSTEELAAPEVTTERAERLRRSIHDRRNHLKQLRSALAARTR